MTLAADKFENLAVRHAFESGCGSFVEYVGHETPEPGAMEFRFRVRGEGGERFIRVRNSGGLSAVGLAGIAAVNSCHQAMKLKGRDDEMFAAAKEAAEAG